MRLLICTALLCLSSFAFSQYEKESSTEDVIRATILSPGISYEKKVTRTHTLYLHALMSPSFYFNYSSSLGSESRFYLDPALVGQYRFYYNGDKRFAKGSRTTLNSMEYIAPTYEVVFTKRRLATDHYEEETRRALNSVGVVWGLQRNLKNRVSVDFSIGPGVLFANVTKPDQFGTPYKDRVVRFALLGGLTFGFWLNKKTE